MTLIDTTVMNVAMTAIQTSLDTNLTAMNWALNIYSLLFAALAIPLGRFAGKIGIHKAFQWANLFFLLGSLISGIASSILVLIIGRIIQSIGAAVMLPLGMTISYSRGTNIEERRPIVALIALTQGLAAVLGPTIGGILTQYLSWRWAFFINIPINILIIGICWLTLEFKNEAISQQPNDIVGSLLSMLGLFSLILALIQVNSWGWASIGILSLFTLAFLCLIVFIWYERHISNPMIPMDLFTYRDFNLGSLIMLLSTIFHVGVFIILPTFYVSLGHTTLSSSLLIMYVSIALAISSPLSSILLQKIGTVAIFCLGFLLQASAFVLFGTLQSSSNVQLYLACVLLGAGYGLLLGPAQVLAAGDLEGELLTASQSVLFVVRQVGLVLAFSIFLSLYQAHLSHIGTTYTTVTAFTSIYLYSSPFVLLSILLAFISTKRK